MTIRTLTKAFAFLAGTCMTLLGVISIYIAASGAVETNPVTVYAVGVGFVLAAAPFLAFPFSTRAARRLLVLALFVLACGMLWLAFRPDLPIGHPMFFQVAAIAFGVMLLARVGLALRRNIRR